MANYFSMGECAKIGFDFEVGRTTSKCGNVVRYACSAFKLLCCKCCCWSNQESIPLRQQLKYTKIFKEDQRLKQKNENNKQRSKSYTDISKEEI